MTVVLDACALIALLKDEQGADVVQKYLVESPDTVAIHSLNLCEVYYDLIREFGAELADEMLDTTLKARLVVRQDMDLDICRDAGLLKAEIRRISLADAFALALSSRLDATLLTSDHKELDSLVDKGLCRIEFIR